MTDDMNASSPDAGSPSGGDKKGKVRGGISAFSDGRGDLYRVDPAKIIIVAGFNARNFDDPDNQQHIEDLAASIAEVGVKVPVRVRLNDGKLELVDGECRLRATLLARQRGADIKNIPVISEDRFSSAADLVLTQITANSGKNFSPLEKATIFKRLLAFGWTETEIAKKTAHSSLRVRQLLELSAAPIEITRMVSTGQISASLALETMKDEGDGEKAIETLKAGIQKAQEAGMERATGKHVRAAKTQAEEPPKLSLRAQRDRLINLLEAALKPDHDRDWISRQFVQMKQEAGLSPVEDHEQS